MGWPDYRGKHERQAQAEEQEFKRTKRNCRSLATASLENKHVQRLLWAQSESVQRESGPAVSVSDAAHGGSAGLPDLWRSEPQRFCAAHRRGGYGQDDARQ